MVFVVAGPKLVFSSYSQYTPAVAMFTPVLCKVDRGGTSYFYFVSYLARPIMENRSEGHLIVNFKILASPKLLD